MTVGIIEQCGMYHNNSVPRFILLFSPVSEYIPYYLGAYWSKTGADIIACEATLRHPSKLHLNDIWLVMCSSGPQRKPDKVSAKTENKHG